MTPALFDPPTDKIHRLLAAEERAVRGDESLREAAKECLFLTSEKSILEADSPYSVLGGGSESREGHLRIEATRSAYWRLRCFLDPSAPRLGGYVGYLTRDEIENAILTLCPDLKIGGARLSSAGLLTAPDGELFLIVATPAGTRPIFKAQRDNNGQPQPIGDPLFDVRQALAAPDKVSRIIGCLKLRQARADKGWIQKEAAATFGMSRVYYNYLEVGKYPMPSRLRSFAGLGQP